jgi:Type I phosphodiesterase / nucleotide pyrophosphatase
MLAKTKTRALVLALACVWASAANAHVTKTVVLIVSDGLRWQEVFTGADPLLLNTKNGGSWMSEDELKRQYWRSDPKERRRIVFPFIWGTVAQHGQIFGNRTQGSDAHVTNKFWFSYPGYNEMSTGFADPRINSNEFGPNPNVTVFEWLNKFPDLHGHVAIYGTWQTHADIFNLKRSGLVMQAGWQTPRKSGNAGRDDLLAELFERSTHFDVEDTTNPLLQATLLDYVRTGAPRVLFVGYGETDNWGHQGRYDLVLDSAHRMDGLVEQLWNTMQSMPQYRGTTTFIITCDHGRGSGPVQWKEHGVEEPGSQNIWIAVMGPDTPPLGEREHIAPITQSQIAATIAALLDHDYRHDVPAAAEPIAAVLGPAAAH